MPALRFRRDVLALRQSGRSSCSWICFRCGLPCIRGLKRPQHENEADLLFEIADNDVERALRFVICVLLDARLLHGLEGVGTWADQSNIHSTINAINRAKIGKISSDGKSFFMNFAQMSEGKETGLPGAIVSLGRKTV